MDYSPFVCLDCNTGYHSEDQWRLCCPPLLKKAGGANLVSFLKDPGVQARLKRLGVEVNSSVQSCTL